VGDTVSGRVVEQTAESVLIELGEGIRATCAIVASVEAAETGGSAGVDLSQLSSMLSARWKGGATAAVQKPEPLGLGQIRSFQIVKLDREAQRIELKLA
jgi:small subunit ribosomal protein S1